MEINPTQQPAVAATRPARRVAPRLLLATLVALPLTLAACSTQTEAPPAPLPMPSVNTTAPASGQPSDQSTQATPVPSTGAASETPLLPEQIQAPVPSDVALENSADGAEAYAYFLFQAWWYLINTHDLDWWDTNIPDCDWKHQIYSIAAEKERRGLRNETAEITPYTTSRKVNPENSSEFAITLRANVGDIYEISKGGTREISTKATTFELTARLEYRDSGWKIVGAVNSTVGDEQ
ncbi:DUF6318 family protein [Buchananella felis]|uniref:DUF6318 family protein n=1 Tax=Buchananella felis TaxID=3231492 RepID=UPI0035289831